MSPLIIHPKEINPLKYEQKIEEDLPKVFENEFSTETSETKEPEMFENSESEEDFEIPAFLRKQKN